jgi:hypothetical protein
VENVRLEVQILGFYWVWRYWIVRWILVIGGKGWDFLGFLVGGYDVRCGSEV